MYGFVVTTAGQGMLTRAAAGEALTLTGVQVGKGVAASREAALALTALIDPVANGTSTEPAVSGNQLSMIVEYRNDMNGGLEEGFDLSEFWPGWGTTPPRCSITPVWGTAPSRCSRRARDWTCTASRWPWR